MEELTGCWIEKVPPSNGEVAKKALQKFHEFKKSGYFLDFFK
jgi:hypothetical protein